MRDLKHLCSSNIPRISVWSESDPTANEQSFWCKLLTGCILARNSTSEACEWCEKIPFLPLSGRLASSVRLSLISTDVFSVGGNVRTPSTAGENKQVIYWILSDSPQKACPSQSSDSRRCRRRRPLGWCDRARQWWAEAAAADFYRTIRGSETRAGWCQPLC